MQNDLLTRIEIAGGAGILYKSATREERTILSLHVYALKKQGHAIVSDEIYEPGEETGDIRITHFLSCKACQAKNEQIRLQNGTERNSSSSKKP